MTESTINDGKLDQAQIRRRIQSIESAIIFDTCQSRFSRIINIVSISLICTFLCMAGYLIYLKSQGEQLTTDPDIGDFDTNENEPLTIIRRNKWMTQPPKNELTKLELPLPHVIIAHTATKNCTKTSSCVYQLRMLRKFQMESKGYADIEYNFMIGGDGVVYEGRGWDYQGIHTRVFNKKSIGIAFIGTFSEEEPPQRQIVAAQKLIESGVELGKLSANYTLYGQRQLILTESPGSMLYENIKKWPRWSTRGTEENWQSLFQKLKIVV